MTFRSISMELLAAGSSHGCEGAASQTQSSADRNHRDGAVATVIVQKLGRGTHLNSIPPTQRPPNRQAELGGDQCRSSSLQSTGGNNHRNMEAEPIEIVIGSGQGINILVLVATSLARDLIVRLFPECETIVSRPLRPGEAQFLQRVIPEIVR